MERIAPEGPHADDYSAVCNQKLSLIICLLIPQFPHCPVRFLIPSEMVEKGLIYVSFDPMLLLSGKTHGGYQEVNQRIPFRFGEFLLEKTTVEVGCYSHEIETKKYIFKVGDILNIQRPVIAA